MLPILSLWLPIVVSAVFVFIASSVIHMALRYHAKDFRRLPGEERIGAAMREAGVTPGEYAMPYAAGMKEMGAPEYQQKLAQGPVATFTVRPSGPPSMGRMLLAWFVFILVVSAFAAYVAGRAVPAGGEYLEVFRFAGTTALMAYALGTWSESIWYGRKWSTTLKNTLDGVIYALITAGTFGWLWPGS